MGERLTAEDARILALERGNIRGHTCKLLIVEGTHGIEKVREAVSARIAAVPRLKQRLSESPLSLVDDEDFRVERHVRDGGEARGERRLRAELARLMTEQLARERPLWAMDVIA